MASSRIDSLVLGCTHYPYLIPQIRTIIGSKIKIIDSGEAVAKQTKTILTTHNLLNTDEIHQSRHTLYINKDKSVLENLLLDNKDHNIKIIKRNF
jgi:glutamate racemase